MAICHPTFIPNKDIELNLVDLATCLIERAALSVGVLKNHT